MKQTNNNTAGILKAVFCCVFWAAMSFSAYTQTFVLLKDMESFKSNIKQASKETKTIASLFKQERHLSMMTQPIMSEGKFLYKRPASVRWEYTSPHNHLIIFSRRKVYVKDDEKTKAYDTGANKMFKDLGEVMFRFILGDIEAAENDYNIDYKESDTQFFVKLIPKVKDSANLSAIDLFFDKKNYSLDEIVMHESGSDFTRITFFEKVLNENISNSNFRP